MEGCMSVTKSPCHSPTAGSGAIDSDNRTPRSAEASCNIMGFFMTASRWWWCYKQRQVRHSTKKTLHCGTNCPSPSQLVTSPHPTTSDDPGAQPAAMVLVSGRGRDEKEIDPNLDEWTGRWMAIVYLLHEQKCVATKAPSHALFPSSTISPDNRVDKRYRLHTGTDFVSLSILYLRIYIEYMLNIYVRI